MRQYDDSELFEVRDPVSPDREAGIATTKRISGNLFQGWGPKLLAGGLAASAVAFSNSQAKATTLVAISATCQNHGARLISSPSYVTPNDVNGVGEAVYLVTLSATGKIEKVALEQSAGDPVLDFTAMRVVRESRYAAAADDCRPTEDSFFYAVDFDN